MPRYAAGNAVRVSGLDELRGALKAMGVESVALLGQLNKQVADVIAKDATSRAEKAGGVAAKSAPSIKASAATGGAAVTLGNARFPFALGAEFGALQYKQFKPWRGNQWVESGDENVGYFLHPAIRDDMDKVEDIYLAGIDTLTQHAFPDG